MKRFPIYTISIFILILLSTLCKFGADAQKTLTADMHYFLTKDVIRMIMMPTVRAESATLNAGQW